jgi:NAD(P)-dependent dehydrogenase (short-subunit alcohol dehydrogenase family)
MTEPWNKGPVLVTGGTGHIGLAIVKAFAEAGAVAIAVGSSESRTRAAADTFGDYGNNAHAMRADTSNPENIENLFEAIEARFGPVAVLVNGAGINFNRMISDVKQEEYDRLFEVNVRSMFFASRRACESMISARIQGRIVNITSGNYRYARPDGSLYAASKAAMEMLNRGFSLEYGDHGIAINAVAPGLVDRPNLDDATYRKVADYYRQQSALHRLPTIDDVANAVLFLASSKASGITGETIVVDGGFSAGRLDFPRRVS